MGCSRPLASARAGECPCVRAARPRTLPRNYANDRSPIVRACQEEPERSAMRPSVNFVGLFAVCLAALTLGGIGSAAALDYPTRPVRWVVPYTPGGGTAITARIIAQWLSERLRHQFVYRTKPAPGHK